MASAARTLSLPFRVDPTGGIAFTEDPRDQLTQQVYSVLSTQPGERIMRPDYGCNLRQFDFAADSDPFLQSTMLSVMQAAMQKWVPQVLLESVLVGVTGDDGILPVTVLFRLNTAVVGGTGTAQLKLGVATATGAIERIT